MLVAPEGASCPCECHDNNSKRQCTLCCPREFRARERMLAEQDCANPKCECRPGHCRRCYACGYCSCERVCACAHDGYGSHNGACWSFIKV